MSTLTSVILKNDRRRELIKTNKLLSRLSLVIVFLSFAAIMVLFSRAAILSLNEIGESYAFVNMLLLMNFFLLFTENIFQSLNVLYFSKDLKMFLRLPLKPIHLVHSKMVSMIFSEYQIELLMLAIPMAVYGIISKAGFLFYIEMIAILAILPIIPIVITTTLIAVIMRLTSFIKNKSKVIYTTIFLLMILFSFYAADRGLDENQFSSLSNMQSTVLEGNELASMLADRFILLKPIMNILTNGNVKDGLINLAWYMVESVVIYGLGIFLISKIYLKGALGTILSGKKSKKRIEKLSLKDVKKRNVSIAYLMREFRTIARSPLFFVQCMIMPVIQLVLVLLSVVAGFHFLGKNGIDIVQAFSLFAENSFIYAIFIAVQLILFMLNFTSIIAVSKDARSAVMLKTLPIALAKQFQMKIILGFAVNLLTSAMMSGIYYYCTRKVFLTFILFLLGVLFNLLGEKMKLIIDLKNPQTKWDTEFVLMKQNTNVLYELFYSLIATALIVGLGVVIKNIRIYMITLAMIILIIHFVLNHYVNQNAKKIFQHLIS
ncbi:MAG: hypothetical protein IJ215_00125 [Clostridia bacterium]|nr:hypothetical protein [Clostridia bacterium]